MAQTRCEQIEQWLNEVYIPWYTAQMTAAMTESGNNGPPPPPPEG